MTEKLTFYRYVPHGCVPEYERLGWKHDGYVWRAHHSVYSILMEWCGDGEPRGPNGNPCENDEAERGR